MTEERRFRIWLPSRDFLVFTGVVVVLAAIAVPGLLSSARASRERNASATLKAISSANEDFYANDRDGNKVKDFWTGDVSGLYYAKSAETGKEIHLIELNAANADSVPLFTLPTGTVSKLDYFYRAMDWDETADGDKAIYRADTDGSGRKVHHLSKFGFCAYPRDGWAGKYAFNVNENGTIFRQEGTKPILGWRRDWVTRSGPLD
jgi:type II secretory pathway pseudopilin PulG